MSETENKKHLVLNCELCGERGLHIMGEGKQEVRQCINCGYVSSEQYVLKEGTKIENHEEYKKLTDDMKAWSKSDGKRLWIPIMMTLPFAMLYPQNVTLDTGKIVMKWFIAYMTGIPQEEQKNYPVPGYEEEKLFYNKKYDTDNAKSYDSFLLAMSELNQISKTISEIKEMRKGLENNEEEEKK